MDETVWIPMECKDLEGEVLYYHRKLGNQTYAAHVFLVQYDSPEKLKNNWERLNEEIAGCYQGDVDSLLERSNFIFASFLWERWNSRSGKKSKMMHTVRKSISLQAKKSYPLRKNLRKLMKKSFPCGN